MPFKIISNTGKKVVLRQSYQGKIALYFSENYHYVNAYNLAILAQESYEEYKMSEPKLPELYINHVIPPRIKPDEPQPEPFNHAPFLVPYFGDKKHANLPITEIKAVSTANQILRNPKAALLDSQGFHYNDGTYNVFVFRGTLEVKDFLSDFYAPKIDFMVGKVHEGFYENFSAVKDQVIKLLNQDENKKCKTIITGHSLGAAVGTLVAAYLKMQFLKEPCGQVMLYTFGSPRVGDKKWVGYYRHEKPFIHFRHRRKGDPITMLPPHHSSMRMPSLPATTALYVAGTLLPGIGAIAGPVLVGASFIFNSDGYDEAFVHHGQGILIQHTKDVLGIIKGNLPPETVPVDGKLFNGKQVVLYREFVKNLFAFAGGMEPHAVEGYVSEIKQLFHNLAKAWEYDPQEWINCQKVWIREIETELEHWKKARAAHVMEIKIHPIYSDATATERSNPHRTDKETEILYDDIINYLIATKHHAETQYARWRDPNLKSWLFTAMLPESQSRFIEKEIKWHLHGSMPNAHQLNPKSPAHLPT